MPFIDTSLNHLAPLGEGQGSGGITTGFGENFRAGSDQQFKVRSLLGLEVELNDRLEQNLERINQLTGQQIQIDDGVLMPWVRDSLGAEAFGGAQPYVTPEYAEQTVTRGREFNAQLQALKQQYPEIQTFDDMLAEVRQMRGDVNDRAEESWSRAGAAGMLGNVLGSAWGSMSFERDPLLVGSMFLPGFGRLAATRILSAATIGGGTEAAQQFGGIQPTARMLGEDPGNPWFDVVLGAALGGAFQGAVEVPGPAFRAAERRLFPDRARARVFRDTLEEALGSPQALQTRPTNEQLLEVLRTAPQTSGVRSARSLLENEIGFLSLNPYGTSRSAYALARADMTAEVERAAGRQTSTAVGRFIPQQVDEQGKLPDVIRNMARLDQPDLFTRLDAAELRLQEAEAGLETLRGERGRRTVADTISMVDPEAGARVREIETELDRAIPRKRRQALEAELDTITESMVPDRLAQVESDFRIGQTRRERSAQSSRNAARKEYNRLRNQAKRAEDQVVAEMRVRTRVAGDAVTERFGGTQAAVAAVDAMDAQRPAIADSIVRRNLTPDGEGDGPAPTVVDGASPEPASPVSTRETFDIGGDNPIPADRGIPTRIADDKGNAETITARQMFQEIEADEAMVEAIRTCAL